jgi:hypothetical protein
MGGFEACLTDASRSESRLIKRRLSPLFCLSTITFWIVLIYKFRLSILGIGIFFKREVFYILPPKAVILRIWVLR